MNSFYKIDPIMDEIRDRLAMFFNGTSSVKVGIGVAIVEGMQVANIGLNLKTAPNLMLLCGPVNEVAPFMKFPASLVVVIELGPDAI